MMHIVCTTDSKYIMPIGIMIKSVCVNNSDEDITFHVITDGSVSDSQKKDLDSIIDKGRNHYIQLYKIDDNIVSKFPNIHGEVQPYITQAAYYRLFLADILPDTIDKVLYLDGDIVVRKSLKPLWSIDISDFTVACVPDMTESLIEMYNRLHIPVEGGYFNSGVLLINLKKWRETNIQKIFIQCVKDNFEIIKFHDQDVLNVVCNTTKHWIPITFNFQNGFLFKRKYMGFNYWKYAKQIEEYKYDPTIVHFISVPKPWYRECNHPFLKDFLKYKAMTPWADVPIRKEYNPSAIKKAGLYFLKKMGIISEQNDIKYNL